MAKHPLYDTWNSMIQRTTNSKVPNYEYYGGRGIMVCDRWRSFELFCQDIGDKPSPDHSIDRIDNSKGYCPENCRWATYAEQCSKRRSKTMIEFEGASLPIKEWARRLGIIYMTLYSRLKVKPVEEAFSNKGEYYVQMWAPGVDGRLSTPFNSMEDGLAAWRELRGKATAKELNCRLCLVRKAAAGMIEVLEHQSI